MYIIVGDPHFGIKSFSFSFFDNQLLIWEEICKTSNKLNAPIISTGDLFDNRIIIDINFFNYFIEKFIGLLKKYNVTFYNILGNHDIYYKSTRKVNLIKYLSNFYDKFYNIEKVTNIDNLTLVPWIINKDDIPQDYNDIVIGHFEFKNIDKYIKGTLDINTFSKAKLVISGHYHNYSKKDNIIYVGTPYQLTWSDFNQKKGYYILDNKNYELKFIENNKSKKFIKIIYNEENKYHLKIEGLNEIIEFDENSIPYEVLENNFFKFIIEKTKTKNYQKIINDLINKNLKFEIINNNDINLIINKKIEIKNKNIYDLIPKKYYNLIEKIKNFEGEKIEKN